jgi:hypothetical protein
VDEVICGVCGRSIDERDKRGVATIHQASGRPKPEWGPRLIHVACRDYLGTATGLDLRDGPYRIEWRLVPHDR